MSEFHILYEMPSGMFAERTETDEMLPAYVVLRVIKQKDKETKRHLLVEQTVEIVRVFMFCNDGFRQATHCFTDLINGVKVENLTKRDYTDLEQYPFPLGLTDAHQTIVERNKPKIIH